MTLHNTKRVIKAAVLATLAILTLAALTRIAAAQSGAWPTILREGAEEYAESCAACHGTDFKGSGELGRNCSRSPMT